MKAGRWDRKLYTGTELSGKTLAVLGLGRIGREVAFRMQAFGMKVIGFDPMLSVEAAKSLNIEKLDLEEIWPQSDYITVHTPLIPQTRNLINDAALTKCKQGVRIINVARGGIVDEAALLAAIEDGRCGGAALDVFCEEPPKNPTTLKLIKHPKVVATPHLGASTVEAQQRVAVEIAEQFVALAGRGSFPITGVVNAPVLAAEIKPVNAPWIDLARELAKIAAKMVPKVDSETTITINTSGETLQSMNFLTTAVLMGILNEQTTGELNLINAPTLAKELGITVTLNHDSRGSSNTARLTVAHPQHGSYTVEGTVRAGNLPYLLSVNGASFEPAGVLLENFVHVFRSENASTLHSIIGELVQVGASIRNVSVAAGKISWFAVKTVEEIKSLQLAKLACF